jgi:ATP-dependent DNA helicase RecG
MNSIASAWTSAPRCAPRGEPAFAGHDRHAHPALAGIDVVWRSRSIDHGRNARRTQPVNTHVLRPQERERAFTLLRGQIKDGKQGFIIYPLVEESEKIDARAAVDDYETLSKEVFPDLKLGLLHGRMRPRTKKMMSMLKFRDRQYDILVSTTVVEVGVDVPNATVMIIEGADRFGLAQLHQLRGRVGRGQTNPIVC